MTGGAVMKVKAKCNLKDNTGWHMIGEVFETDDALKFGEMVEVIEIEPKITTKAVETEKTEEPKEEPAKRPYTRRKPSK